jgi:Fe2+ transport system protein FeoA
MNGPDRARRPQDLLDLVPLTFLRAGQSGWIGEVFGPEDLVHRLREMGLRHGAEVQMVRPGNPCIIRLGGQRLCFRAEEGTSVLVRRGAAVAC